MGIADRGAIERVEKARENRVPDTADNRHGTGLDTVHPIAHHEVCAGIELTHEARNLREVICQVCVDHDYVVTRGSGKAREVRPTVAAARLIDDGRAGAARD